MTSDLALCNDVLTHTKSFTANITKVQATIAGTDGTLAYGHKN